jgi:ABC-2 type transport system ATP-binding protein
VITARGLAKSFLARGHTIEAVRGVDLDVAAGEVVGFLGPNGAGKTTTLRMLTTLLRPTAGTATVAGHDLLRDPAAVRRRIGYVAQGGATWPQSKVIEEIELQGRLHRVAKAEVLRRAAVLMERLELDDLGQRLTATLSGGQRRRLDIVLGLIHEPNLIFLDEPSTGLDPQSRANLWEHIRRLRDEHGVTVFMTTHYMEEADTLCDRILIIDNGAIVSEGTPDALKAHVSGDAVLVVVASEHTEQTAEILGKLAGAHEVATVGADTVRLRVPRGDVAMPELFHALDAHGIAPISVQVNRPTLEDVFLSLTGRGLREGGIGYVA